MNQIEYVKELKNDIETFACERIDKISNIAKENEEYINYKNISIKLFEELKNELTKEQKEKLMKLLDTNFIKNSILEKKLYLYGFRDGVQLEQKAK